MSRRATTLLWSSEDSHWPSAVHAVATARCRARGQAAIDAGADGAPKRAALLAPAPQRATRGMSAIRPGSVTAPLPPENGRSQAASSLRSSRSGSAEPQLGHPLPFSCTVGVQALVGNCRANSRQCITSPCDPFSTVPSPPNPLSQVGEGAWGEGECTIFIHCWCAAAHGDSRENGRRWFASPAGSVPVTIPHPPTPSPLGGEGEQGALPISPPQKGCNLRPCRPFCGSDILER